MKNAMPPKPTSKKKTAESRAAKTAKGPRRLTSQKIQEQLSRAQIGAALEGWNCNQIIEDLGEDILVGIYEDGRSTGLSFHIQAKSTTNLRSWIPKKDTKVVRYPIEVKDLKHWEDASPPVVLVVWDVVRRTGCWQDVPAIIDALTKTNAKWRSKGEVHVSLPVAQRQTTRGRTRLRHRLGTLALPSVGAGKTLEIRPTFTFPRTPEGLAAAEKLKAAIEHGGDPVTIQGANIAAVKMSQWWERMFGESTFSKMTIAPKPSDMHFQLFVDAVGPDGTERLSVDMKRAKAGTRTITFSNDPERDGVRLSIVLDKRAKEFSSAHCRFGFSHPHSSVSISLILTKMMLLVRAGGVLRLALPDGKPLALMNMNVGELPPVDGLQAWERLLTVLAFVQHRTARYGLFKLHPNPTNREFALTNKLQGMCADGVTETRMDFRCKLAAPLQASVQWNTTAGPLDFAIEIEAFGEVRLFGVTVPQGKVRVEFLDDDAIRRTFQTAQAEGLTELHFKDAQVRVRFLDWIAPNSGPEPGSTAKVLRRTRKASGR
jgi:hypothetical protein